MMNNITMFNFKDNIIRTLIHDNGSIWFFVKEVCEVLGISNSRDVVARLDEDEKGVGSIDTLGGNQNTSIINESGLYSLVLSSRKPDAKLFKKWVTSEVLPSIRKTGEYSIKKDIPSYQIENPVERATKWIEEYKEKEVLQNRVNNLIHTEQTFTATQIAKELGIKSAKALNDWLVSKDFQYKNNKTYVPKAKYADCGYMSIKQMEYASGVVGFNSRFTAKGRDFVIQLFKEEQNKGKLCK